MISLQNCKEDDFTALLKVKDYINQTEFLIRTHLTNSVLDLKHEIENEHENLLAKNMRLIFSGRLLNNDFSLLYQGVKNFSYIHLIPEKVQKECNDQMSHESKNANKVTQDKSSPIEHLNVFQVYRNSVRTRRVKLSLHCSIINLDIAFSSNSIYIFNGEILDKSRTFEYYNIVSGNSIVLISIDYSNENPDVMQKWLKLTSDTEHFQNLIDSNTNNSCSKENSRLIDLKFNNLELLKSKQFLSFYNEQYKKLKDH